MKLLSLHLKKKHGIKSYADWRFKNKKYDYDFGIVDLSEKEIKKLKNVFQMPKG